MIERTVTTAAARWVKPQVVDMDADLDAVRQGFGIGTDASQGGGNTSDS